MMWTVRYRRRRRLMACGEVAWYVFTLVLVLETEPVKLECCAVLTCLTRNSAPILTSSTGKRSDGITTCSKRRGR